MSNLAAGEPRRDKGAAARAPAAAGQSAAEAARMFARVRRMMVISGLTTFIAIAAVISIVGYRVYDAFGSAPADVTVVLPKGAVVLSSAVTEGRIVVLFDVDGSTEVRTFDARTLKQTGRIVFASKP
jgi:hypothetical protein